MMRGAAPYVLDTSLRSFKDAYDHSFQPLETIDNDRDRTSDVRDLYIRLLSASTDNTIKLLTLVATIFLPLGLLFCGNMWHERHFRLLRAGERRPAWLPRIDTEMAGMALARCTLSREVDGPRVLSRMFE